jgi:hypothetical protein
MCEVIAVVNGRNIPELKPLALSISTLKFGPVCVWVEVVAAETGVVTRDPWRVTFQGRLPEIHKGDKLASQPSMGDDDDEKEVSRDHGQPPCDDA